MSRLVAGRCSIARLIAFILMLGLAGSARADEAQVKQWIGELAYQDRQPFAVQLTEREELGQCKVFHVQMPSPMVTDSPSNNRIVGLYFRPLGNITARSAVIVLPMANSRELVVERMIASYLAHMGFKTVIMALPYQQSRGTDANARSLLTLAARDVDVKQLHEAGRQGVLDAKRVREWLVRDEGVDPESVGIVGMSLGSLAASVTYSTDPNFRAAALILSGGGLGDVIWGGSRPVRRVKESLIRAGRDLTWARNATAPLDPLTYATPQRRDGMLLITALQDEVFPPESHEKLSKAYGQPSLLTLPADHNSAVFYMPMIVQRVGEHMSKLLMKGQAAPTTNPAVAP